MKLTPEQKAFFEYGGAWEQVVLTHKGIRSTVKALPGKTRQKLIRQARNETHQHELVLNAWQKRAACRAWVIPSHERICENCAHEGTHPYATPCSECFRCPFAQVYEGFSDNWEPRKEGE